VNPVVTEVTARIAARSASTRSAYLERIRAAAAEGPARGDLGCANLAHGLAACGADEKLHLRAAERRNVAIVSAYNDMLSAHQPFERYPSILKKAVLGAGGVAQVAGGVPAMCDGITQGRAGMELSLFSRDVVAMSTAIALSHDMFDGALMLGVCDKIVPGLLIGALSFGHLPTVFVPAGPMPSGIPNGEKSRTRQRFAAGEIGRDELLEAELGSYHSPGTCTFYGTANSNQLVVEAMGLHLPGASFVNPGTDLRRALTVEAGRVATQGCAPIGEILDERALVNGVVALLATGGSTNHTMHLVAVAAAAGLQLTWDDFADLSAATPLLARVYPNGPADINQFHAAGGVPFVIGELLDAGLMHPDVDTVAGHGLGRYRDEPYLDERDELRWRPAPRESRDPSVLAPVGAAFAPDGGIRVLDGGLGRAVMKVSAVAPEHRVVTAPARVFDDQAHFLAAFDRGELDSDIVAVVRHQGPRANGMPELHKLTPALGVLMDRGHRVALVTDGRMSGASGKVPAALHCTPEAAAGGPLSRLRDGDVVRVDAETGRLEVDVDLHDREPWIPDHATHGTGRELFAAFRERVGRPDEGASVFSGGESERVYAWG
jgi:phosphogluconate dehydratase